MSTRFFEQLRIRLQQPLPGKEAQFLMAPAGRQPVQPSEIKKYNPRRSAVLIVLFPFESSIFTLLIQRPVYNGVHSGQVAFPGGKFEETDIDIQQTALRETYEEVGITDNTITIIGKLTDIYIPPSNFLVSPFIGFLGKQPELVMNGYEVQKIITVDLFGLNNVAIMEKTVTNSSGYKIKTPCYEIEGLIVWGATAMMISELNVVVKEAKLIEL